MVFDPVAIILLVTLLALAFTLGILVSKSFKSKPKEDPLASAFEGNSGLRGRLEKLEHTVNDLRTDTLRLIEISGGRIDQAQRRLDFVAKHLELNVDAILEETQELDRHAQELVAASQDEDSSELSNYQEEDSSSSFNFEPQLQEAEYEDRPSETLRDINKFEVITGQAETAAVDQEVDLEVGAEPVEAPVENLKKGLSKTRSGFFGRLKELFTGRTSLTSEQVEEAEALLIGSDLGVSCSQKIITAVKEQISNAQDLDQDKFKALLKVQLLEVLGSSNGSAIVPKKIADGQPKVVLVVGVNGVGKTTTVAKLAHQWNQSGAKVLLIAADTFRAAAVAQLQSWGDNLAVEVFSGDESQKPAAVVFDGLVKARSEQFDVVLVDTAGRLHNKANLMQELDGIGNVIKKFNSTGPDEVVLVVDACTGQNALNQARDFNQIITLSGIIITKLDGTPKGGIVVAIKHDLGIPVRYIGVGEGRNDLQLFDSENFVDALLSSDSTTFVPDQNIAVNAERRRMRRSE